MRERRRATIRSALSLGAGAALLVPSLPVWSAAFALQEQSASRLGSAFAGAASKADDATTMYYNVAGLAYLERPEALVVVSAIDLNTEYDDEGSIAALGQPLGVEGGDAGGWSAVPNLYAALPLDNGLAIGLAVNVPFGLVTDWDDDWMGRFQARRSEIETINIAPSIAWRPTQQWAIGLGINYQIIDAKLTNAVNYSAAVAQGIQQLAQAGQIPLAAVPGLIAANAGLQGSTRLDGDDEAWGFTVGVLFEPMEGTRIGLSYRSKYEYDIEGDVEFEAPTATNPTGAAIIAAASAPGARLSDQLAFVDITLPELVTASVTHEMGAFTLMADVSWQRWSRIEELRVLNEAGGTISVTPEEWDDTWRFNLGGEWAMSDRWTFRAGIAYDQSAVPTSTRTPRLPDTDRYWVALGARWLPSEAITIDGGYAHLFAEKGDTDQRTTHTPQEQALSGVLLGEYEANINILAVQLAYRF